METAVAIYNALPPELWTLIAASTVAGTVMTIKHKWHTFLHNKPGVVMLLVGLTSLIPGLGSFILENGASATNPWIIGLHTMVIGVVSQPVYFGIVKRVYALWVSHLATESLLTEQAKSAIVPPEGLPGIPNTAKYADDF